MLFIFKDKKLKYRVQFYSASVVIQIEGKNFPFTFKAGAEGRQRK
jgi:hypothetical protein